MTRSGSGSLYDDDFFAWTQDQAAALRGTPPEVFGNRIDVAHVAEEIEDLGKRDLREVHSFLTRLFEHLIKVKGAPTSQDVPHWRAEIRYFHDSAIEAFSESMRQLLDMDSIWRKGRKRGQSFFTDIGVRFSPPLSCPFVLDEVLTNEFDVDAALTRLEISDETAS